MFEKMKLGVERATALAVAHAIVREKALGVFISECEIMKYILRSGALAGNSCYPIIGRTNTGTRFSFSVTVVGKRKAGEDFPIEKAIVGMENKFRFGNDPPVTYFECTFPKGDISIRIRNLSKSPHEIVEEQKQPEPVQEGDLFL